MRIFCLLVLFVSSALCYSEALKSLGGMPKDLSYEEDAWNPDPTMTDSLPPPSTPPSLHLSVGVPSMKSSFPSSPDLLSSPKMKEFIEEFSHLMDKTKNVSLSEARKKSAQFFLSKTTAIEQVKRIETVEIFTGDQASIPLRIYIPKEKATLPVLVFFHGGGWVFGSIEGSDALCRKIANILQYIVVSVEYRLSPEYPFPTPLQDCFAATVWVSENIDIFGGDHTRIIVGGESAGGNLAAGVSLLAKDKGSPHISSQLLMYPAISSLTGDEVYDACPDQFFMTKAGMRAFWKMYLQSPGDAGNPYACPDQAPSFSGLPSTVIITAEYDPLKAEGERYGSLLQKAGVPVVVKQIPEVIHGCIGLPVYEEEQKRKWIVEMGLLLKKVNEMKALQNSRYDS